ncbi:hypothetical protein D7231_31875 [Streptomyces klenkii]|uniref:Uncharacterized protein n=1 Tax=Streptomyces klenkii TaxID=1420899 RepID=A0A3B0AMV3_9ACTN|nr:hypothetical protein [Streptomyces klenkii]RKN61873.1 hypothetical protein D7231_31875 [Streptomyces klenkii]
MPDATPDQPRNGGGQWVRTPETARRDAEAAALRARGLSYRQIADELGVARTTAHEMVERALQAIVQEPAEQVRQLELDRLDHMYRSALGVLERRHVTVSQGRIVKADDGEPLEDDGPVLQAIDRMLRIQERRARLLGLDAPSRVSVDAEHLGDEIGALLNALTNGGSDDNDGPER